MRKCTLEVVDEVNVRFLDLAPDTRRKCNKACEYFLHKAKHSAAYKMGRWDGKVSLFAINGNTFVNALEKVLPIIVADGYEIEVVDKRQSHVFNFDPIDENFIKDNIPSAVWPKGHGAEGQPIILRDYQVEAINRFIENPQSIQILSTGAGKEQPLSSRIRVPGGWKLMGDMKVGDSVITPKGDTAKVVGVFPQGKKDVYEFTLIDGRKAYAGIEHLWRVYSDEWFADDGTEEADGWQVVTTDKIIKKLAAGHLMYIAMPKPENVPDAKLPMDPFLYGSTLNGRVDPAMFNASPFQKLAMMEGIESVHGKEFYRGNPEAFDDIVEILRSIGAYGITHNVEGNQWLGFHLPTLGERSNGDKRLVYDPSYSRLRIMNVQLVRQEECQCISLDSKDKLYVTDDWVVTHNTVTSATLSYICEKHGRTIIIVPSKSLVLQTERDYKLLNLDVGVYFGDRKELGRTHTICTWQSLQAMIGKSKNLEKIKTNTNDFGDFLDDVVCVMVDEAHGAASNSLKNLLAGGFANIPIRWGFTGTIPKEEHLKDTLEYVIGKIVGAVSARELMDKGVLAECDIKVLQLKDHMAFSDYHEESKYLCTDKTRLKWLAAFAIERSKSGNTMILVDKIETGETLAGLIPNSEFISGKVKANSRKETYEDIQNGTNKIVIATYGVAAVGIDIGRIFNLFLLEPGKSFVRVIQSIGRGIRKAKDKDSVFVFDVTSTMKFSKRHLTERKAFYKDAQYQFEVIKVDYINDEFPRIVSKVKPAPVAA